jgi:hypothetical protein
LGSGILGCGVLSARGFLGSTVNGLKSLNRTLGDFYWGRGEAEARQMSRYDVGECAGRFFEDGVPAAAHRRHPQPRTRFALGLGLALGLALG